MDAQPREVEADAGLLGGDAQIAGQGDTTAGADRVTADGRDAGLGELSHRQVEAVEAAHEAAVPLPGGSARVGVALCGQAVQQVQVAAGGEGSAGAGQHHRSHVRVGGQLATGGANGLAHRLGHGVQAVRVLEGEQRDGAAALESDEVGHAA
jgi:hypothetical protein